jgi:hypothetical protein
VTVLPPKISRKEQRLFWKKGKRSLKENKEINRKFAN